MENTIEISRNVNDGYFKLSYENDGVFLTIYPALSNGKKVTEEDIVNRLARKKIKNYTKSVIDNELKKPSKKPVKIAEPQEEVFLDAKVNVYVANNKMKAHIVLIPPDGGRKINREDIINELKNYSVVYGINNELINSLIDFPAYNEKILIAEGKDAVNGKSGQIEFFFSIRSDSKPTILEDGTVDYRDLNIIKNAVKGQKLCSLIPPVKGVQGKNVLGIEVKAIDGKEAKLPRGRNVEITDDEDSLVASIDGEICFIEGKVNVYPNYEVPADVGTSTGNIKFVGNVTVKGNVTSGYEIEAGGNVEVFGVVESAVIKAKGDIILRRGIQGKDKGKLICSGDVISRYIESSFVQAGNSVKSEAIMHSDIKCKNSVELSGKKGLLVGGKCKVGKEISAKVIGSHMATTTEIEVGSDPELKEKLVKLKNENLKLNNDTTKTDQAIIILQRMKKAGSIEPKKEALLAKSLRTNTHLKERIQKNKKEIENLNNKLSEESNGKLHVSGNIYQGCKITIGTSFLMIKDTKGKCTIYRDGDIKIVSYEK